MCPFNYTAVAGSGMFVPINRLTTPVGWLYSLRLTVLSRSAIVVQSNFWWRFCVANLALWYFCWYKGFCHRTESDLFLFRAQKPKAPVNYCDHALSGVRRPSVVRRPLDNLHFQLLLQNRLIDVDETWYGWSTQGPLQVLLFFGQIRPGADPGRVQNRSRGPLLQRPSSSDRKATATNRIHSSDLKTCGKKCSYFWFHSEVKFLTPFWRLFGLSHFGVF